MHVATPGSGGFFDDEDAAAAQRPAAEELRPAWVAAPDNELPARIVHDLVIARTDAAVIVLTEVRAFSNGFEVLVDWFLRRLADDAWEWQRLTESAIRGGWMHRPADRAAGLRFGIAHDGRKLPPVDVELALSGRDARAPAPPTTMPKFGGAGGGDRLHTGSGGLWVWTPNPLRGPIELVTEWLLAGIPQTAIQLDGDDIAEAVAGVRPLWE